MVPVPAGEFVMGSAGAGAKPDEQPQHKVRIDQFWIQAHEVTWDAYLMFMFADQARETEKPDALVNALSRPTAPHLEMSFGRGNTGFPAISMTQHAANKFAQWLSAKTGEYYRLPTEAEWEYACRAGTTAALQPKELDQYAWFKANSAEGSFTDGTYHKIGTKKPNAWGVYDMLGNVMEWTLDQHAPYTAAPQENPWVKATAAYPHAVRGGSWNDDPARVSCTVRVASDASWKKQDPQLPKSIWYMTDAQWLGFRLVRPGVLPSAEDMYRAWNNGVELDPF
jgi:formylglycine-generating enzyme required for sulfatase activity